MWSDKRLFQFGTGLQQIIFLQQGKHSSCVVLHLIHYAVCNRLCLLRAIFIDVIIVPYLHVPYELLRDAYTAVNRIFTLSFGIRVSVCRALNISCSHIRQPFTSLKFLRYPFACFTCCDNLHTVSNVFYNQNVWFVTCLVSFSDVNKLSTLF